MITKAEAEQIITEVIGPATAGDGRGWRLIEFEAGWVVWWDWMDDTNRQWRGGGAVVVERESGRVMSFMSSVAVDSIMERYDQVVGKGYPMKRDQRDDH